jgi:hypothetical protein
LLLLFRLAPSEWNRRLARYRQCGPFPAVQAFPATGFPEATSTRERNKRGLMHCAASQPLPIPACAPCLPLPCMPLSGTPWWGVTPTTHMEAPSPSCRVDGGRGAIAGPVPSVPLRTVRDRFRVTRLSGGNLAPVSASAHHVRFPLHCCPPGLLRLVRGFPTLPGEASLSRLLSVLRRISLSGGRRSRVSSR